MKFSHSFVVQPADIDAQGHVNNVRYLQWIQDVAVAHWLGKATQEQIENIVWVVLRHEIDYLSPAFAGEEITAETWVGAPAGAKWERFTEIRRGAQILVQAKSIWVALDAKRLRPRRVDADLINTFANYKY